MTIPIPLAIACMFLAFLAGLLVGDKIGWVSGVLAGYSALKWPDSQHFAKARRLLNWFRARDGLPAIEEEVA